MNPISTLPPKPLQPELSALATQFSTWRAQRPHRHTPIPQSLRQQAVSLLAACRPAHITKALGINHAMLKAWQVEQGAASQPSAFVSLEVPHSADHLNASPTELTIANRSGQQVTLHGGFSAAQLALVARALSEQGLEFAP